jgi:hypothetical protein
MNDTRRDAGDDDLDAASEHELLLRLDLATETLEGLEQLGVDNREELLALLDRLEARIADAE